MSTKGGGGLLKSQEGKELDNDPNVWLSSRHRGDNIKTDSSEIVLKFKFWVNVVDV